MPTLNVMDENSEPFIVSEFRYRSTESIAAFIITFAASVGLLWFVPKLDGAWRMLPVGLALSIAFISVCLLKRIVYNAVEVTRIDNEGIYMGTAHWPWSQVEQIFADGLKEGFVIELKMRARGELFEIDLPFVPGFRRVSMKN